MTIILSQIECHRGNVFVVKVARRTVGVYPTYRAARKAERDELKKLNAKSITIDTAAIVEQQMTRR